MTTTGPSCAQFENLYKALRAETGPKTELTEDKFVDIVYAWLVKQYPVQAAKHKGKIKPYLRNAFKHYLDKDGNGTVSSAELETTIKMIKKSNGCK